MASPPTSETGNDVILRSGPRAGGDLARHILTASGTMIGICTTLIGLIKIIEGRADVTLVDECAAVVAGLFLCSAGLSYFSIRHASSADLSRRCEKIADGIFLMGLVSIVAVAALFAFEKI